MGKRMVFGRYDYAAFLCFICYASCSLVVQVSLVPLANDLQFPLAAGGMSFGGALQIGRSIPMVIAMLGCGFASAHWGNAKSLGLALILMGSGILISSVAPVYGILFAALILAGLGEGVIEGLATPLVQDLHQEEPGRYINFSHGFWSVGVLGTVLLAGYLLNRGVSWRYVVGGAGILTIVPILLLLSPTRKYAGQMQQRQKVDSKTVCRNAWEILTKRRFWLFFAAMFLAGGGEFCLTFWCASFIQLEYAGSPWAAGIGTACFAAGMIIGRTGGGFLIRQRNLKQLILYSALAATAISIFFPYLHSLEILFVLLFFAGIATGPFWPSVQSYCADRMPQVDTTMLFILLSCAGVPGCGFFTLLMGVLGDYCGLRTSFLLVPLCFLLLAGIIGYDWYQSKRESLSIN